MQVSITGIAVAALGLAMLTTTARADWAFTATPSPIASIQTANTTLELQCDRIRFAPAGAEDARDIARKQGLSLRFLKNATTEVGAFQVGAANATVGIVDNFPVEITFTDRTDYDLVLSQIARNSLLNLSMADQDVSYGLFDLKGSAAAIKSLRAACAAPPAPSAAASAPAPTAPASMETPEGVVYCGGGQVKRQIEFLILKDAQDQWNARVTVNGKSLRAMTAYSYFGNAAPPRGFVVALLGEDRSEFLVFRDGGEDWLEYGDYTYRKCN